MLILKTSSPTGRAVALPALLLMAWTAQSTASAGEQRTDRQEKAMAARLEAEESLRVLTFGEPVERLRIAENACMRFTILDSLYDDAPGASQVVDQLVMYLRHEDDEWIAVRLLDSIDCYRPDVVRPLFLEALASSSPNFRWQAFRWLEREEEPEAVPGLQRAWSQETRPWARSDLIKALTRNRAADFIQDFLELAESDDPQLASPAIGALKANGDERAIGLLSQMAREARGWRQAEAAEALGAWPKSPEALASLLVASDSQDPKVRSCALFSLSRMEEPSAMLRVLSTAMTDAVEDVRKAGVAALNGSRWHEFVDRMLRGFPRLPDTDRSETEELLSTEIGRFPRWEADLPDPSDYERDRREREPKCVYSSRNDDDPDYPEAMRVSPSRDMTSARCYEQPGNVGYPGAHRRIPRGSALFVSDHFELGATSWVSAGGPEMPRCWLPMSQIVPASQEAPVKVEEGVLQWDFDMPVEELQDPAYLELSRAGMVKAFDEEQELVGVSLRFEMGHPGEELLLGQIGRYSQSSLAANIRMMLSDNTDRLCDSPILLALATNLVGRISSCLTSSEAKDEPVDETDPSEWSFDEYADELEPASEELPDKQ